MAIFIKPGVQFTWAPAGFIILDALKAASKELGVNLTITSGSDGTHSGPTDPHKLGVAYDIRSKDMSKEMKGKFLDFMKIRISPRFYIFLEAPGTENEHWHAQRAKNTTFDITDYLAF